MHNFFEQLSKKDTILHRLDIRVKIISIVGFILISSSLKSILGLATGAVLIMSILIVIGTPIYAVLHRVAWVFFFGGALIIILPFITPGEDFFTWNLTVVELVATAEGVNKAIILFLRLLSAVLAVTLLNATAGFRKIIGGFRKLKMPGVLVGIIEFAVRYFFVLSDEAARMKLARKARAYDFSRSIAKKNSMKTLAQLVAVLFIRSLERSERVHLAMIARGYGNNPSTGNRSEKIQTADILWGTGFLCFTLSIKLLEVGGFIG